MLSFANHASQTSAATYASMLSFATYASILSFATDVSVFAVAVRNLCVHTFLGHLRVHTLFCHRILRPCVCNGKHDYFPEDPLKTFCSVYDKRLSRSTSWLILEIKVMATIMVHESFCYFIDIIMRF